MNINPKFEARFKELGIMEKMTEQMVFQMECLRNEITWHSAKEARWADQENKELREIEVEAFNVHMAKMKEYTLWLQAKQKLQEAQNGI